MNLTSIVPNRSLKQNLRVGEEVCRAFKNEFPVLRSNTLVAVKIDKHAGNSKFRSIIAKLKDIQYKYESGIKYDLNVKMMWLNSKPGEYVTNLKKTIAAGRYANCPQHAIVNGSELLKRGESPHLISLKILDIVTGRPIDTRAHVFPVFGLKENAWPNIPQTWGNKAVVADTWANRVMPAGEAVEYYKELLGFNPAKHMISYAAEDVSKLKF